MFTKLKLLLLWLLLAGLYFVAARVGLSLAFEQANTSPVWPPTGIAIAALLYFGYRAWPGVFLGAFISNFVTELPIFYSISVAIGNTLEATVAYYLIGRFATLNPFDSVVHVARFVTIVLFSTMISATVGITALAMANLINLSNFKLLWFTWWLGNVVGGLIVTPFLVTWLRPFKITCSVTRILNAICLSVTTLLCTALMFIWSDIGEAHYPIAFVYLPIAIWAAFHFHQLGATLFLIVVSSFAIYGTLLGYGPFVRESANESLLLLQGFMGVIMVTVMALAASNQEREKANQQLAMSQLQLEQTIAKQTGDLNEAASELRLAESVFNESVESIMITDQNALILRVNPAFTRITGYSAEEVIGKNPKILQSGRHHPDFYQDFWDKIFQEHSWQGEIWDKRKNGEIFPTWQTVTAVLNKRKQVIHYISIFSDISERKVSEERIHRLAHFDVVTGLQNRAAFHEELSKAISHAQRHNLQFALLYLDLDNFKLINDASGHRVGDMLLRHVATRIKSNIREEDTIARIGGDEFVILLVDIETSQNVVLVAKKILDEMSNPILLEHTEVVVTASIGVTIFPYNGKDGDTLLKNADVAMYQAKAKGRNNYQFFTKEMNARAQERLLLENDIRRGIEKSEFLLYFQPQVSVHSGKIIGCEALLRWMHPERGMVLPGIFIPIAEESGLIRPLGDWVMRNACRQQQQWRQSNLSRIHIAVNVSGKQFLSRSLVSEVKNIIAETGIDPADFELELTESTVMENVEENISILKELHQMNIQLAIDDFGTGYSSMAYLKRFPIDKLKVDQSFVRDIVTDPEDAVIVEATTALGHSLHMKVIAEGVSTKEQFDFLKAINCDEIQGYYVSKPLPAEEFTELLRKDSNLLAAR